MSKQRTIITIDLSKYCTQQQYAIDNNVRLNTISQRVKRTKEGKTTTPIDFIEFKELNNLVLIKR